MITEVRSKSHEERIWNALKEIGIHNMEEFEAAKAKIKPINIGCFIQQPVNQEKNTYVQL